MSDTKDILNLIKTEAIETKAKINNLEAKVDNIEIKLDNLELKAGNLEKQQKQISLNNAQQFDRLKEAAGKK